MEVLRHIISHPMFDHQPFPNSFIELARAINIMFGIDIHVRCVSWFTRYDVILICQHFDKITKCFDMLSLK